MRIYFTLGFCNALAAISAHRSVPALLATNTNGTYAGKCLIDCLESIIGLEVMINTKPG